MHFCEPLKYKLGKQVGIRKFLYMLSSPKPLLGRNLLEQMGAVIRFEKGEITLEVNDQQYMKIMGLLLATVPTQGKINEEVVNQVYPGI